MAFIIINFAKILIWELKDKCKIIIANVYAFSIFKNRNKLYF